jgi:two-component system LytT family response regulator
VRSGARTVLVPALDVERIEADGDYATLHAGGKTWLVRERLHTLATQLDPRVSSACTVPPSCGST